MTKYTDEEIIEYLRTLRVGDVLTAVKSEGDSKVEKCCEVRIDPDGDRYILDDNDAIVYVNIKGDYKNGVYAFIRDGIFEIPTQANPFSLGISQVVVTSIGVEGTHYHVNVSVNEAGLTKLRELEAESLKASELSQLYAERDEIQRKISELEAVE